MPAQPEKKIDTLRALMAAGQWSEAIKFAAKFPKLPTAHRAAILDGNEAMVRPGMQRQLGKDPAAQIEAAKAALVAAYSPSKRWCIRCPGNGAHLMSCAPYKGGLVKVDQPYKG